MIGFILGLLLGIWFGGTLFGVYCLERRKE